MKSLSTNLNKNLFLFLLLLILVNKVLSQSNQPFSTPTIIPPSPTAQAYMRYGEIPIDYSTGIPQIEIPLYTVKSKNLELPISISYHASGIKVNDVASEVGLGWVLNCGGMVSRTICGLPDEAANWTASQATYETADEMYNEISNPVDPAFTFENFEYYLRNTFLTEDHQSDRFFYSLPNGTSGIFKYDLFTKEIVMLPYHALIIRNKSFSQSSYSSGIYEFKITDENGTTYTFEPWLQTEHITNSSDFYLTKVVSFDKSDSILIEYELRMGPHLNIYSTTFYSPYKSDLPCFTTDPVWPECIPSSYALWEPPRIKKITTSLATIDFNYQNNRLDFDMHKLHDISIKSKDGSVMKNISFSQGYFGSGNSLRMRLDTVIINASGSSPEIYSFKYETQAPPDYPGKIIPPRFNEDFWGYNNNSNTLSLVPGDFIPSEYQQYSDLYGNRNPDTTASKACMIKEIKYPTGGRTVFRFERNFASNVYTYRANSSGFVGGYRVGSITNYDENNKLAGKKTYKYGYAIIRPITVDLFTATLKFGLTVNASNEPPLLCDPQDVSKYAVFSNPFLPLEVAVGLPIVYKNVVEYNGTETNNTGKTVYTYNKPFSPNDINDNPIHPSTWDSPRYLHPFNWDKGNYLPELTSKSEYLFDGQNYRPVSKTIYTYTKLFSREFQTGLILTRLKEFPYTHPWWLSRMNTYIDEYNKTFAINDTKAYEEANMLTKTQNYIFDPSDSTKYVLTTTDMEYDQTYLQLTKKTVSTSISNYNRITEFYYPFNYYTIAPYDSMVRRNNIAPVIEQIEKINTTPLQSVKTNYNAWSSNIIAPITLQTKKGSDPNYSTRINYVYDNISGNLITASKANGINEGYYWGYNDSYPVVQGVNITNSSSLSTAVTDVMRAAGITDFNQITQPSLNSSEKTKWNTFNTNLRSALSNAMVRTFTYKPLVGMTSSTDENGKSTYYEYDNYGRLATVKDNDGLIISQNLYHYAGQSLLEASSNYVSLDYQVSSTQLEVSSDLSWTATSNNPWITVTKSGATLTITCSANSSAYERLGSIMISGVGITNSIPVQQAGAPPYLRIKLNGNEINTITFTPTNKSVNLTIETNAVWNANISQETLIGTLEYFPVNGTGNASINVDGIDIKNGTYSPTTIFAKLTFKGDGIDIEKTITFYISGTFTGGMQ